MPSPRKTVLPTCRFTLHEVEFLFGALRRINLRNANSIGQITHFAVSIARDEHQPAKIVLRSKVCDKRCSFAARFIAEPQRCRISSVDRDYAFESALGGRKPRCAGSDQIQLVPCDP